jgi:hypothetical protein
MSKEIWKDVPNYEGMYQVSNLGRVKSLKRKGVLKDKILKSGIGGRGYNLVGLMKERKRKTIGVHKLVAMAFLNHKPNGYKEIVDHINNVKADNCLGNIQIISNRENTSKDRCGGTSNYVGVCYHKRANKWMSSICIDGKMKYLGYYTLEIDASKAYQEALKCLI